MTPARIFGVVIVAAPIISAALLGLHRAGRALRTRIRTRSNR